MPIKTEQFANEVVNTLKEVLDDDYNFIVLKDKSIEVVYKNRSLVIDSGSILDYYKVFSLGKGDWAYAKNRLSVYIMNEIQKWKKIMF